MRVLLVNCLYAPHQVGGAEKSVQLLAESLLADGDAVAVFTLGDGKEETTERVGGVLVRRVPHANLYWPFDPAHRPPALKRLAWHVRAMANRPVAEALRRFIRAFRPDVVHINSVIGLSPLVIDVARGEGVATVATLRDYSMMCSRSALFRRGRTCKTRCLDCRLLTRPWRRATEGLDHVGCNSRHIHEAHRREGYFEGKPHSVIYNVLPTVEPSAVALRSDGLVFGYIGRVVPEKGVDLMLEAFAGVRRTGWSLIVAGTGEPAYVERLKATTQGRAVRWLGFVPSAAFYAAVDVVIVPSIWGEPLPRTIIEAYAHGKTAISSDAGGSPEVAALGRTYALYPAASAAALAEAVDAALAEPERWRSAGGFLSPDTRALFTAETVVAATRAMYAAAIEARAGLG